MDRLVQDARTMRDDPNYQAIVDVLWQQYQTGDPNQRGELVSEANVGSTAAKMALVNMGKAFSTVPSSERKRIIQAMLANAAHTKQVSTVVKHVAKQSTPILLAYLSVEALVALRQWWEGQITGQRCASIIIDATSSVLGGVAGGLIGTAVAPGKRETGNLQNKYYLFQITGIGTLIGCVVAGTVAKALSSHLTTKMFDLAPSAALDHAYQFMELSPTCTNDRVNERFRELAKVYYPDKGGSAMLWLQLQTSQQIIKMAREK